MCFLYYFQKYNQTPENIFQNIFWNATKHLKIFSFPENIFLSGKYFTSNQTQPKTSKPIFLMRMTKMREQKKKKKKNLLS